MHNYIYFETLEAGSDRSSDRSASTFEHSWREPATENRRRSPPPVTNVTTVS
jgi:hypothetical protein